MQTFRLAFRGTLDLAQRLAACTGGVLHVHDTWYRCLAVEAVEAVGTATGDVLFEQCPTRPDGPEFPFDVLLEVMSGPG